MLALNIQNRCSVCCAGRCGGDHVSEKTCGPARASRRREISQGSAARTGRGTLRLYGESGDLGRLHRAYREAQARTLPQSRYERTLRYEYAAALWTVGQYSEVERIALDLATAYMDHLDLQDDDFAAPIGELHSRCLSHDTPDDFKRLADCFNLVVGVHRKLGSMGFAPWAVRAHKLYVVTGATRSAINSGQDMADVLRLINPLGALEILDRMLLAAEEENLLDVIIGVRSQRAEVLARTGDVAQARMEIDVLSRYNLTSDQAMDIQYQSGLIDEIADQQPPA